MLMVFKCMCSVISAISKKLKNVLLGLLIIWCAMWLGLQSNWEHFFIPPIATKLSLKMLNKNSTSTLSCINNAACFQFFSSVWMTALKLLILAYFLSFRINFFWYLHPLGCLMRTYNLCEHVLETSLVKEIQSRSEMKCVSNSSDM